VTTMTSFDGEYGIGSATYSPKGEHNALMANGKPIDTGKEYFYYSCVPVGASRNSQCLEKDWPTQDGGWYLDSDCCVNTPSKRKCEHPGSFLFVPTLTADTPDMIKGNPCDTGSSPQNFQNHFDCMERQTEAPLGIPKLQISEMSNIEHFDCFLFLSNFNLLFYEKIK
jgi:hypothetical protein